MKITKKSTKLHLAVSYLSILLGGIIILINPISTYAVSVDEVVGNLPVIGGNQQTEQQPEQLPPDQEQDPSQSPTDPLTPVTEIVEPIVTPDTPDNESALPLPAHDPPVVTNPVTPKPTPPVKGPVSKTTKPVATSHDPAASQANVHVPPTESNIPSAPAAPVVTTASTDTSAQSRQLASAQGSRGDIPSSYPSLRITDSQRNDLYKVSIAAASLGLALYLVSLRNKRGLTSYQKRATVPVTVNN